MHDDWLFLHQICVAYLSILISLSAKIMSDELILEVAKAGLLHDVGMVEIDPIQLKKPRHKQSCDERRVFELHPVKSFDILKEFSLSDEALLGILQHHESILGIGYPKGLKAHKVSYIARIIQTADEFAFIWKHSLSSESEKPVNQVFDRLRKLHFDKLDPFALAHLYYSFQKAPDFSFVKWA